MTRGQVSSLSPTTKNLIKNLEADRPIIIEAYLSADVPEQFTRTKYDLLARLKEFQSLASRSKVKLDVRIHDNLDRSANRPTLPPSNTASCLKPFECVNAVPSRRRSHPWGPLSAVVYRKS